jgi:hypothetical protein
MDWLEDWEYPNDHIYAMERQKDIEMSWQQWEEEESKSRLPATIKIVKVDEVISGSKAIRGTHQTRL